jgi:predicted amidohydrolase YtcJ
MTRFTAALIISLCLSACGKPAVDERTEVDLILHNGKVITMNDELPIASVVAISGTEIVAVGGDEILDSYKASDMIGLGGKVLMPGFVDSHTHLRGQPQRHIDLTKTRSIEELKGQVRDKVAEIGTGEWITGYGWSEDVMAELRRPFRSDLDEAAPENPVLLTRAGGHSAVANSMALRLGGRGVERRDTRTAGHCLAAYPGGDRRGCARQPDSDPERATEPRHNQFHACHGLDRVLARVGIHL